MGKNVFWIGMLIALALMTVVVPTLAEEDRVIQTAIDTFKSHVRLPPGTEVKFLEKNESPISEFYAVKLLVSLPDKEIPTIVYVDKAGERVLIGNLFVKGENLTKKEAGPPKPKKIDMSVLEMEKSPSLGNNSAKVTIVEFSNFQCPYCMDSWSKFMGLMKRYPQDFKYIFKHFPFQPGGKTFELSEMAAAAQEVSNEAFWLIHDFFFTKEGQDIAHQKRETIKQKVEQLLKGKGSDLKTFQSALETGRARNRVLEDMALANRLRLSSTPTKIVNGDLIVGLTPDSTLERYLGK
ncbi:MAG: thioredoxin domain-containing protein [Thermodesulfobacteriota bacterium]